MKKLRLIAFVFIFLVGMSSVSAQESENSPSETQQKQLEIQGKNFLRQEIDRMIQYLDYLKNSAQENIQFTDAEQQNIVQEVEIVQLWLEDKKESLDAISYNEIRSTAEDIRSYWKQQGPKIKKALGKIQCARTKMAIEKAEDFGLRLEQKVGSMQALRDNFVSFNTNIRVAQEKHSAAQEAFEKISSLENETVSFQEGSQELKASNQALREAYSVLRGIIQEMKELKTASQG
jgi:hypothetical protein